MRVSLSRAVAVRCYGILSIDFSTPSERIGGRLRKRRALHNLTYGSDRETLRVLFESVTKMPHARGFDPGRRDPPGTREREELPMMKTVTSSD